MTQMVQAKCPGCAKLLHIPADWVGDPLRCKYCQTIFQARTNKAATVPVIPEMVPVRPPAAQLVTAGEVISPQQIRRAPWELLWALFAILVITIGYLYLARDGVPRSSSLLGHALGMVGFLLMLATETLYSLRKRAPGFSFGRMSTWLQIHIVSGIVGSYLVLLHSGWKFNGLAGLVMLLTLLIVVSGFVGRYIYTAVPRTLDGVEIALQDLEQQLAAADKQLQAAGIDRRAAQALALTAEAPQRGWMTVLGRGWLRWRMQRRLRGALRQLRSVDRAQAAQLQGLLAERYRLQMQINSLAVARRLLALWHVVHIPLGAVLFTLAFLHIGGALYYATWLK
jgi:hypothetical protein